MCRKQSICMSGLLETAMLFDVRATPWWWWAYLFVTIMKKRNETYGYIQRHYVSDELRMTCNRHWNLHISYFTQADRPFEKWSGTKSIPAESRPHHNTPTEQRVVRMLTRDKNGGGGHSLLDDLRPENWKVPRDPLGLPLAIVACRVSIFHGKTGRRKLH